MQVNLFSFLKNIFLLGWIVYANELQAGAINGWLDGSGTANVFECI